MTLYQKICAEAHRYSSWFHGSYAVCRAEFPDVPVGELEDMLNKAGVYRPRSGCGYQGSMSPMDCEKLEKLLAEWGRMNMTLLPCGHDVGNLRALMRFDEAAQCQKEFHVCAICGYEPPLNKSPDMHDAQVYDADYFLRGRGTGKSLYEDYRWLPELTIPMVCSVAGTLGVRVLDSVMDFGCARGYTVKALKYIGYKNAFGVDASEWAVANCDPDVKDCVYLPHQVPSWRKVVDWVIAKDVLEHVPQVADKITELMDSARSGVFAVVPLSQVDGEPYIVADYEKDVTHIHRLTLPSWLRMFARPGWKVTGSYMFPGVKQNYQSFEMGNGFIVARRQ